MDRVNLSSLFATFTLFFGLGAYANDRCVTQLEIETDPNTPRILYERCSKNPEDTKSVAPENSYVVVLDDEEDTLESLPSVFKDMPEDRVFHLRMCGSDERAPAQVNPAVLDELAQLSNSMLRKISERKYLVTASSKIHQFYHWLKKNKPNKPESAKKIAIDYLRFSITSLGSVVYFVSYSGLMPDDYFKMAVMGFALFHTAVVVRSFDWINNLYNDLPSVRDKLVLRWFISFTGIAPDSIALGDVKSIFEIVKPVITTTIENTIAGATSFGIAEISQRENAENARRGSDPDASNAEGSSRALIGDLSLRTLGTVVNVAVLVAPLPIKVGLWGGGGLVGYGAWKMYFGLKDNKSWAIKLAKFLKLLPKGYSVDCTSLLVD